MARFSYDEVEKYGGQGGAGYFSLKNDRDVAQVRFLYNTVEDIEGYSVHEVEIDGKKRYVNCLREYDQPVDDCPFCRERRVTTAKLFIPLYNIDADKVQVWERGKKFMSQISSLCARYSNERTPLVSQVFEVERNGAARSTSTTYGIYPVGQPDNTRLEDFEMPQIVGSVILDKSADEMESYLSTGSFPSAGEPVRRRGEPEERRSAPEERRDSGRRVPARNNDRF